MSAFPYPPLNNNTALQVALRNRILTPPAAAGSYRLWEQVHKEQCLYDNVVKAEALRLLALCQIFTHFNHTLSHYKQAASLPGFGAWASHSALLHTINSLAARVLGKEIPQMLPQGPLACLDDERRINTISQLILSTFVSAITHKHSAPPCLLLDDAGSLNNWGEKLCGNQDDSLCNRVPVIAFGDSLTCTAFTRYRGLFFQSVSTLTADVSGGSLAFAARLIQVETGVSSQGYACTDNVGVERQTCA